MHRIAPLLFLLLAGSTASAQSDSTPATAATTATSRQLPELRAGQWAARFGMSDNVFGIGAIYFTSPRKAWTLGANVSANYYAHDGEDNDQNIEDIGLSAGRRWYGTATGRLRPIGGIGLFANYHRQQDQSTGGSTISQSYGGGVYGELGAQIFFAPELSLGATWQANLGASYYDQVETTAYNFSAGGISIEGAFYF